MLEISTLPRSSRCSSNLPIRYATLACRKSEFEGEQAMLSRMKRDIVNLMFENLEYLQRFDKVKICYDDGQSVATKPLHDAAEHALSTDAVVCHVGSRKTIIPPRRPTSSARSS